MQESHCAAKDKTNMSLYTVKEVKVGLGTKCAYIAESQQGDNTYK